MTFVPVVPYVPPSPPSPRTRELAELLSHAIREYEAHHPALTGTEVRAALDLAREAEAGSAGDPAAVVVVLLGALVLFAGVAFFGLRSGSIDATSLPLVAISVAVVALLVGVVLVRKRSGR